MGPHWSGLLVAGAAVVSAARRDVRVRVERCMMRSGVGVKWNENLM